MSPDIFSRSFWRRNSGVLLGAVVLLGLFLYAWGEGPAVTSDSWHYIAAARSWVAGQELLGPTGAPYVIWGPLYPLLLASLGPSAQAMVDGLVWLHAVSLVGSLVGWSWLGGRLLGRETAWKRCYPWVLAVSTPWLMTAKFVWSETCFLLLFTVYAVALYNYLSAKGKGWWLVATLSGLLLPLQRTAGLFVLAGVAMGLLVAYGRMLRGYVPTLILHFLLSVSGVLLWQVHVWRTGLDLPLVTSNPASVGVQALNDFGFTLVRWLLPVPIPPAPIPWVYLVGGMLVVVLLIVGAREIGRFGQMLLVAAVIYVALHALSYQLSRGSAGFHDSERYAAVFYGPVVLLLFGALRRMMGQCPRVVHWLLLVWLLYPAVRVVHNAVFLRSRPVLHLAAEEDSAGQKNDSTF